MEMLWEYVKAFLVGGVICAIGQVLIDLTKLTPARILTGYVVAGVILGGLGIYKPIIDFGGAGATVPIIGFGYLLAKGVKDAVLSDGLVGVLSGGFTSCAAGLAVAIVSGLLVALIFKEKSPK